MVCYAAMPHLAKKGAAILIGPFTILFNAAFGGQARED
jgi:hypothetical protein